MEYKEERTPQVDLRKCAVIGCGHVGATVAYTLMQSGLLSDLCLIDIDREKASGEAADLAHALPFHPPMDIYAGDYSDLSECGIVILCAGEGQRVGEKRTDAMLTNARIFEGIVKNLVIYNKEAILLVVTNPVEILAHLTQRLSGFPAHRVIGAGTVLDTARLKQKLGAYLGVDSRNVHSFIIGEHGEHELPVWSSANISGVDFMHYCESCKRSFDPHMPERIFCEVRESGYEVLRAKGATYYAIAESVKRIVSAILRDENAILPVSVAVDGHYGIEDVYMSLPSVLCRTGVHRVLEIPLSHEEEERLFLAADKLKEKTRELETVFSK
ncbi:MAG: L-lactate dehydrogenase [Ruminococcaceae bacterium]|nr:L-lactate dehydrogenase [Oscillospiraceae bacterium]